MKASIFLLSATLLAAPAAAQPSNIFVFGDSLVDAGNAQLARAAVGGDDPAPASLGYFNGRFSNGPTFADYASELYYGASTYTAPSLAGGNNFSFGGAQAQEIAGDNSPSFLEQIGFFTASGKVIDGDALVIITLGGNDVRRELARFGAAPTSYETSFVETIAAMRDGLEDLYALGARNVVITGLPNVGGIPAVTSLGSQALNDKGLSLSTELNGAFRDLTTELAGSTGTNTRFFDFLDFQNRLYANPTAYGLPSDLNTTTPCIGRGAALCDRSVFFDPVHPTTAVHRAVALELVAVAGVPEPATWGMMIVGFAAVGTAMRRRRNALTA